MAIYCNKCGARHECSVCPVCAGFGLSNLQVAAGVGKSFQSIDELREKFEDWFDKEFPGLCIYVIDGNSTAVAVHDAARMAYQAAHASRDAEVEALRKRINDAPVYYVSDYFAAKALCGWLQVIGSVKALKDMRGKHVRLVIDAAMREVK